MPSPSLSLWPVLAFRAYQKGYSHGFRLWTLARALDGKGSGKVKSLELRHAAGEVGLSTRDYHRYLRSAKKAGMLTSIQVKSQTYYLILSTQKTALAMDCYYIGARRAKLPIGEFFKRDWLSLVWAGWIATLQGKPMSRDKMHALTGVSQRTQRLYEKARGITALIHYAHDETKDPAKIKMLKAFPVEEGGRPHAFVYKEKKTGKEIVTWRLPDSRQTVYQEGGKGRTRKINRTIKHETKRRHLSLMGQVNVTSNVMIEVYPIRLFHPQAETASASIIRLYDTPELLDTIREVYASKGGGYQCQQWEVLHTDPMMQTF